jgi:hypothetical protein
MDSSPFFPARNSFSEFEVFMAAYLLLIAALLSRVIPHFGWLGFTLVGGSLIYFGAKQLGNGKTGRAWWQMLIPVAALAGVDYYLTTRVYGYDFVWSGYVVTWAWNAIAIVLGNALLSKKVSVLRVGSAAILGPTSFFLLSNFAVWLSSHYPGGMYAPNFSGIITCFVVGLPFYGRDLASTGLVLTIAFGLPVVIRNLQHSGETAPARARR